MMRRAIQMGVALALVCNASVSAGLTYYTFEGPITDIVDEAGAVAAAGLSLGSIVKYTFAVDVEADGYVIHYDDSVHVIPDMPGHFDWFYTDLVAGDYLDSVESGPPGDLETKEYHHGDYRPDQDVTFLSGSSFDDQVGIFNSGHILDWYEGMTGFTGWEASGFRTSQSGPTVTYSQINSTALTLVDVSDTSSPVVPLPGAIVLGSLGLGTLALLRRRAL